MTSRFFALLAVASLVTTVAVVVARFAGGGDRQGRLSADWEQLRLPLAAAVAVVATLGSLYYSEVRDYLPCTLCWYQRIAMYPLAIMLPIAAVRGDFGVRRYATPLAVIGAVIAAYHYVLQWMPSLEAGLCDVGGGCSAVWVRVFGFASIPFMALSGFLLIIAALQVGLSRIATPEGAADDRSDVR